ncbi:MAG TPA: sugar phosphate isomerase/epimerase family protein [Bryobacteraceae bacterium]|nr:sugar phosphate isomerase/epimerase family protein [Bryobacteraceae bacterium]
MSAYSRRTFGKLALAGIPLARSFGAITSTIAGVRMGVQSASFTFSGIGVDAIIRILNDVGLAEIDVMSEHIENYLGGPVQLPGTGRPGPWARGNAPAPGRAAGTGRGAGANPTAREDLRKWRLAVGLEKFREVGRKFAEGGIKFYSYNLSFNDSFTDEEIDKGFQMAKALGTSVITASSPLSVFPRLKPFAEKYNVVVALHNHTSGPDDFKTAMALSEKFWVNLDVGHFFASGYDPLAYIREHHSRITNIHIKDRKKNQGAEMPFGEGDTPLREVLLLLRKEKYDFPACIEYVGPAGPAIELARCLQYCKDVLTFA